MATEPYRPSPYKHHYSYSCINISRDLIVKPGKIIIKPLITLTRCEICENRKLRNMGIRFTLNVKIDFDPFLITQLIAQLLPEIFK